MILMRGPRGRPGLDFGWLHAAELLAVGGLVLLIASLTVFKVSNNDIWIHLTTGRTILETGHVPVTDPYSFTASERDYVAHEWLSAVLFNLVYAAVGVNGLILFKALVILSACAALWSACRVLRAEPVIVYLCFTLMLFMGTARFIERPHIFSYLFLALYLLCYFAYREGGRQRGWLYAIPLLHVLWTNLHGGHVQGLLLLFVLAAAELGEFARNRWLIPAQRNALSSRELGLMCLLPCICTLAALINPYGYRLLRFPLELTAQKMFMEHVFEWKSTLSSSFTATSSFLYFAIWTALLVGSFLMSAIGTELSGSHGKARWPAVVVLTGLWVMFVLQLLDAYALETEPALVERLAPVWLGAAIFVIVTNIHRVEFPYVGIAALFLALAIRHNRSVSDAGFATLPVLAHNLSRAWSRSAQRFSRIPAWLKPLGVALVGSGMACLGLFSFTNSYYFRFDPPVRRENGLGIAGTLPVGAVDYVSDNQVMGNCFASYDAAGLLIHRMWPRVRVAMDSRNDVYGEDLYREYLEALQGGDGLEVYLKKRSVDFFLINYAGLRSPRFFGDLARSGWVPVYFDDRWVVYVGNVARFSSLIERDGYSSIVPGMDQGIPSGPAQAERWIAEAQRAARSAPGAYMPRVLEARALIGLNRLPEAEILIRDVVGVHLAAFIAWGDLGNLYLLMRRPESAKAAFATCLELCPDCTRCQKGLERVRRGS